MSRSEFKYYRIVLLLALNIFGSHLLANPHRKPINDKTIKILTIGNSFSRNACDYLPEIASSVGYRISITEAIIGGSSLEKHANLIEECKKDSSLKPYMDRYTLKDLLHKDRYDYISIQQVSSLSYKSASFQPFANILINFIKTHAPTAEVIIHQTWAYSENCNRLKAHGITRNEMHFGLVKSYNRLSKNLDLKLIPSGAAFYRSYDTKPEYYLWKDDGYHANGNGRYLAGCVWAGEILGISPRKIKYIPAKLDLKTARFFRKVAKVEIRRSNKTKLNKSKR